MDTKIEGDAQQGITLTIKADAPRVQLTRQVLMMVLRRTWPVRFEKGRSGRGW